MSIKAILYDMDGTIFDTESLHRWAWTESAKDFGANITLEFFNRATGRSLPVVKGIAVEMYPQITDIDAMYEKKARMCSEWMEAHGVPVLPGTYHAFGELKVRGIKQCVCTSTHRASAEVTLTRAGLIGKLDDVVYGDDVTRSKPDPQIFLRGAEKLGVDISECAVIEDSPMGIQAGLAAGARVFIVPGPLAVDAELEKKCTRIASLWELPAHI